MQMDKEQDKQVTITATNSNSKKLKSIKIKPVTIKCNLDRMLIGVILAIQICQGFQFSNDIKKLWDSELKTSKIIYQMSEDMNYVSKCIDYTAKIFGELIR
jgi:hypothetical protein